MRPILARVARAVQFEPAMLVALMARVFQSLSGLLTLYFIITYFDPVIQGYYQTFVSLVALQWFVELGMLVAIVSSVSHEWVGLKFTSEKAIAGSEATYSRLSSMTRFVARWFAGASFLMLVGGGLAGTLILSAQGEPSTWLRPWLATITAASVYLWLQGLIAVIEGCNQVLQVALYRLALAVVGSASLWIAVMGGGGLWSLAIFHGVNALCALVLVFGFYRRAILGLLRKKIESTFNWRDDIWPMQWPLALQGVTGYFMFSLFVPVMYAYRGVVEAGRMGLSLQVATALLTISGTWLTVKLPRMGSMFKAGERQRFEMTWLGVSAFSMLLIVGGGAVVLTVLAAGQRYGVPASQRFLSITDFALLMAWAVTILVVQCIATYWRSQRREAVGIWGVLPGIATGLAVFFLGREFGATGAIAGALASSLTVAFPIAFYFFKQSRGVTRSNARAA